MKLTLLVLAIVLAVLAKDPPIYDYAFSISFDETVIQNKTAYKVNGKAFYDSQNDRERVDRANGRYDLFCGTVLPNQTTPCQQITVNKKRWIVFPAKNLCCFCCDADHGCGILKPDWLSDAEYKGQETLNDGTVYDKWSKDGDFGYNYFWTTTNSNRVPRRLSENGSPITDYNVDSFQNQTIPFPSPTFALPSYCNEQSNCPLQSICGQFRSKGLRTQ